MDTSTTPTTSSIQPSASPAHSAVRECVPSGHSGPSSFYQPPSWLKLLCGVGLLLFSNQIVFRFCGHGTGPAGLLSRLSLPDLSFLACFSACGLVFLRKRLTLHLPLLCLVPILCMGISNAASGTGLSGSLETAQSALFLIGGVILFSFMHRYMPATTLVSLTLGLLLNLGVAIYQDWQYGAFLTLAPQDVLELSWGFGGAVTGLFRSKIAFSTYLGATLCWCLPQWLHVNYRDPLAKLVKDLACLLLAVVCLFYISHGLILLVTICLLVIGGFASACHVKRTLPVLAAGLVLLFCACFPNDLHVQSWRVTLNPLKGYDYAPDASVLFNRRTPAQQELGYVGAHEPKSACYDFIAALRLASDSPWHGVGSGQYQSHIGRAYALDEDLHRGQLPDPSLNDVETDNQSGWGILLATLGFPATLAFALLLLGTLAANQRRHLEDLEDCLALHLGSTLAMGFFILAMFITNPLTKGLGWFLALAMASAETGPIGRKFTFSHPANAFGTWKLIVLLVITGAAVFLPVPCSRKPAPSAPQSRLRLIMHSASAESPQQPVAAAAAVQPATAPRTTSQALPEDHRLRVAADSDELFLVFNGDHAVRVTAPMRKETDQGGTFTAGILAIPDQAGVPPSGQAPALKYGGAEFHFQLSRETTGYLWFNVLWEGSCGNTLDVTVDGQTQTYTVGNDGTYHAWHWQRSPKSYRLSPGRHTITVLNREDGIKLAQVLLVNDKEYVPEGVEEE